MEHRRRRAVQSAIGRIDLGEADEPRVLTVDNPEIDKILLNENQPITRNWEASDSDTDISEIQRQIEQARLQKHDANKRATKASMQRLEVLIGIGRLTRDIIIDNVTFSLRSLKSKEIRDVIERSIRETTKLGEALTIRNATLAYCIYKIDDQPIHMLVQSRDIQDNIELIGELEESVVLKLWNAYSSMLTDHQSKLPEDLGETADKTIDNVKKL